MFSLRNVIIGGSAVLMILITGCGQGSDPVSSPDSTSSVAFANGVIPLGATIESATLNIHVNQANGQQISVHRVLGPWEEASVTWNSFVGGYDSNEVAVFVVENIGWHHVDVTSLADLWVKGAFDDFGLILDQKELAYPNVLYSSRENPANKPYLSVCYIVDGVQYCEDFEAMSDAIIWDIVPDGNFGSSFNLQTGWYSESTGEKEALLKFSLEVEQAEQAEHATLGDYVWNDSNKNGLQDVGEIGIPGISVELMNCLPELVRSTVTDQSGLYMFDSLDPGDYQLRFILPDGYLFSPANNGDNADIDSDADQLNGLTECFSLVSGDADSSRDAGMYLMEVSEQCTYGKGYWKNHAGFGPQDDNLSHLLPISLGTEGGSATVLVTEVDSAYALLSQHLCGDNANGIAKLYAHLLAAKLNIANGSESVDVSDAIHASDEFLAEHDRSVWSQLDQDEKQQVLDWKTILDDYNSGVIGPGHCNDDDDDDDDHDEHENDDDE